MNINFKNRLFLLLDDRKIYPWGLALGVSNGAVTKLTGGVVPGYDIQTLIRKKENVNWRWLAEGDGAPFEVQTFVDAANYGDRLSDLIADQSWSCYIVEFGQICTFVLMKPDQYEYKEKSFSFTNIKILTGPYHARLMDVVNTHAKNRPIYQTDLTAEQQQQIRNGEQGTYQLFGEGNKPGLLSAADTPINQVEPPSEPDKTVMVDVQLMRAVVLLVEQTIIEQQASLSIDDKSKVISSVYSHAVRTRVKPLELDVQAVMLAIETV